MKFLTKLYKTWWFTPIVILFIGILIAGTILIRSDSSNTDIAKSDYCLSQRQENFACYKQQIQYLVKNKSVKSAFDILQTEYKTSNYVKSQCHQLTHEIGKSSAVKYKIVADAYQYGNSFCWSGYYHGVMQEIVGKIGLDNITKQANNICASVANSENKYSFNHYNCVHGLGHGFMGINSNELFDALYSCDNLSDSWEKESCYGGVFMENVLAFQSPDNKTKYLKTDDPIYPCNAVLDKFKTQCYFMQTSHALVVLGDFKSVFEACRTKVESSFVEICYQSLGRDASGRSTSDIKTTHDTCLLGADDAAVNNCVTGAVKDFIAYFHDIKQAKDFCKTFDPVVAQTCNTTADIYYKSF